MQLSEKLWKYALGTPHEHEMHEDVVHAKWTGMLVGHVHVCHYFMNPQRSNWKNAAAYVERLWTDKTEARWVLDCFKGPLREFTADVRSTGGFVPSRLSDNPVIIFSPVKMLERYSWRAIQGAASLWRAPWDTVDVETFLKDRKKYGRDVALMYNSSWSFTWRSIANWNTGHMPTAVPTTARFKRFVAGDIDKQCSEARYLFGGPEKDNDLVEKYDAITLFEKVKAGQKELADKWK